MPHSQRADLSSAVNGFTPPHKALFQAHLHPVGMCEEKQILIRKAKIQPILWAGYFGDAQNDFDVLSEFLKRRAVLHDLLLSEIARRCDSS